MKLSHFKILALAPLIVASLMQGYAISFVNKNSDPSCFNGPNEIDNVVNIFVAKKPGAWKNLGERKGFKEGFYEGLALSNQYLQKVRPYLEKGAALIPEYGALVAGVVGPSIDVHKWFTVDAPKYFDQLFGGHLDQLFLKLAGVIAVQRNVPRGNSGFRGSFNKDDIKNEYNIAPGTTLYITIVGKKNNNILMLDEPMKSDAQFNFIVKKDPKNGFCVAIPVSYSDDPYNRVPTGPALKDKNFMYEWTQDMQNKLKEWNTTNKALAAHVTKAMQEISAGKDPVRIEQEKKK